MHFSHRIAHSIFLIGFLFAGQHNLRADQVVLTNGDRISGRLISASRMLVELETAAAGVIRIDRRYVERLSTESPVAVDLVSGERVIGRVMEGEGSTVTVCSSILGERRLPLDAIGEIRSWDPAPVAPAEVRGRGTGSAEDQSVKSPETQIPRPIGQKPEDEADIRKIFLRQSSVLLRPGQVEAEAAISYLHTQSVSSIFNARVRQFRLPVAMRIGLFNRAEGYVTVPAAYARRELAFADTAVSTKKFGLGDASAGINYEIAQETGRRPDIIASFVAGSSTGSKPNEEGLSLGSGHWAATVGVQFIKSYDPVALFWGFSYGHQFRARYFLNDAVHLVSPGELAGYNFGFGFAVNENISLSAQVTGAYQSRMTADGSTVFGSSSEPVSLRSALTYRYSRGTYIEPSIVIGLNNDVPDFSLGLSLTHRFGARRFEN